MIQSLIMFSRVVCRPQILFYPGILLTIFACAVSCDFVRFLTVNDPSFKEQEDSRLYAPRRLYSRTIDSITFKIGASAISGTKLTKSNRFTFWIEFENGRQDTLFYPLRHVVLSDEVGMVPIGCFFNGTSDDKNRSILSPDTILVIPMNSSRILEFTQGESEDMGLRTLFYLCIGTIYVGTFDTSIVIDTITLGVSTKDSDK